MADKNNSMKKFEELSSIIEQSSNLADSNSSKSDSPKSDESLTRINKKTDNAVEVNQVEEMSSEDAMLAAKAAALMEKMSGAEGEKPVVFLSDARFKEMIGSGELLASAEYDGLDEDAKTAYEQVDVMEEGTGKGYGMHWRRRSPMELNAIRKSIGAKAEDADMDDDMFESEEQAMQRAQALGCSGTHRAGAMFMPCATHDEWMKLARSKPEAPEMAEGAMPSNMGKSADSFLCGFQRKSVQQPCNFCKGGCKSEDGLPGLADIEAKVKSAYTGSTVVGSGYSTDDDLFVVDVKRADGSFIEVFMSGDGDELGWLRIDGEAFDGKDGSPVDIISKSDAEDAAIKSLNRLGVQNGEVLSVMVDVFGGEDVYVVEVDSDEKSYDFFVNVSGKVLGYDEYEYETDYIMSEQDEIKALEAELQIKRMYSREQREAMAESGEALPDGSFPIADAADLENAIVAHGRASDIDAAKAHIMKRAKELGLEDMIPADWQSGSSGTPAAEVDPGSMEKGLDAQMLKELAEFQRMMEDGIS